jgi:hypothetical protein
MALEGCALAIGGGCKGGQKVPPEGNSLAPWVQIEFEGSGSIITVGNESSPTTSPQHVACIKSFEFGYSDGLTMRCVIHDEQGGSFVQFMKNLLTEYVCLKNGSPATVRMLFQFGWARAGCAGDMPVLMSPKFACLSDSVETNYAGGKFQFEITGKDLCFRMFEGGASQVYGGEGENGMKLKQAVEEFMTNGCPPNVNSVKFYRMEGGSPKPCPFKDGGIDGPKSKWQASGQDKLQAVLRWLSGHPTDRDKNWIPQYNSLSSAQDELIFWEDAKPTGVKDDGYWDANCIGTYLVNGSKESPVIEFNPKIRWDFARLTSNGGGMGDMKVNATGELGSRQRGTPGVDAKGQPCAGQNTQATMTEAQRELHGKEATVKAMESNAGAQRALKILHDNIEADLTIVGDPTILPPNEAMWAKNVTIVVLNSYFIRRLSDSPKRLEWDNLLEGTPCNKVLSNKGWICKSVSHRIEAGNYTTTIGVFLTAPGIDTPPGTPIGAWTGGWVPTAC